MGNNTTSISLASLLILFIMTCLPGPSIATDKAIGNQLVEKKDVHKNNPYADAQITIRIIQSVNNTFGYDILINGKPLVHQPNIPALPGNEGFTTEEHARKVAEFVVKKIRNNVMPPTVTTNDLNTMGVLK